MRKLTFKIAAAGLVLSMSAAPAYATIDPDIDFLKCVHDCYPSQPNQAAINRCVNFCYIKYDPN